MARPAAHFGPDLFIFLGELARNNRREWFTARRQRYETTVREPALRFITDFGTHLVKISPHFRADPRRQGGSLFRIHRDIRFSRDKSPYKTHTGIHFRHRTAGDAHGPGFYLHLQPGNVFMGCGIWRPDGAALRAIRGRIVAAPATWREAAHGDAFARRFTLAGERLHRLPAGCPADHPDQEDLKLKSYMGLHELTERQVTGNRFLEDFADLCREGTPLVRFLCAALELPF
jgi:uncharacterized protein (TIGR02453 family)